MANFMQMMQKAQQVKQKMQDMQERAEALEVVGEAGGGAVTCRMNGKFAVSKMAIAPTALAGGDAEMLEDLILVALNDARGKAEGIIKEETDRIMKEMGLPPGLGLPF